tara:strand:- start:1756 stop:2328 length:573 start_codon:yes stop_codon:yes gene_type:complete
MVLKVEQVEVGGLDDNLSYVVWDSDSNDAVVVDPCGELKKIEKVVKDKRLNVLFIVNTHGHDDHVEGNDEFKKKYDAEIVAHKNSPHKVDIRLEDGDEIEVGFGIIVVRYLPGHSEDSIVLVCDENVLVGDVVFCRGHGRTDLKGGDEGLLKRSLGKLFRMGDDKVVWPGHNYGGKKTTVGKIKESMLGY